MSLRPLLVKSKTTDSTAFLFTNPNNKNDRNIYGIVPYHSIVNNINLKSDTFHLAGNDLVKPTSEIFLDAIYLYSNNLSMDTTMFIVTNPEKIYGTFLESHLNIPFNEERYIKTN
jgi:hypothetical protein